MCAKVLRKIDSKPININKFLKRLAILKMIISTLLQILY